MQKKINQRYYMGLKTNYLAYLISTFIFNKEIIMIKKFSLFIFALMLVIPNIVSAKHDCKYQISGGYVTSDSDISNVKSAQDMSEDNFITLQGQIEKRISKNMYQFKDSSGIMMVKIDKKIWRGQTVNANDIVQISGKIDKKDNKIILDVDSLMKK